MNISECARICKDECIPVKALIHEYRGCAAAIGCDQGGWYERKRMDAIENILEWICSPSYQTRLSVCGFSVRNPDGSQNTHGEWKKPVPTSKKAYTRICSVCGENAYQIGSKPLKYCPHCGVRIEATT